MLFPDVTLGFVSFAKSAKKRSFFEIIPRPVIGLQLVAAGTSIVLPKTVAAAARGDLVNDFWLEFESVCLPASLSDC